LTGSASMMVEINQRDCIIEQQNLLTSGEVHLKSFYHYLMKFRHPKPHDRISEFANQAYDDHTFPKYSTDYHEISSYLEISGDYLSSMSVFDDAWERYLSEVKNK
jgi:uncharacterized protein YozE (UPF0346 family)